MAKTAADLMQDASEIVHYDTTGIPFYIRIGDLNYYPEKRALCHWHEDFELIRILKGSMNYRINDKKILLKEQDCLLVNSRQMHYGYSNQQKDCMFICILFHPRLFTGNQLLFQKYVQPFSEQSGLRYIIFQPHTPFHNDVTEAADAIAELKEKSLPGYEMEAIGIMHVLWGRLMRQPFLYSAREEEKSDPDLTSQKDMVSYICLNYAEKITLDHIAAAGHVSRSKCCIIFKLYLQQSPVDFLNRYRLEVSCHQLLHTNMTITQIATACGFNHLSYYSKLFLRHYGCTPNLYRKHGRK